MKRIKLTTFGGACYFFAHLCLICVPLVQGCTPVPKVERHRHLKCTDAEGNVVIDTTDLKDSPNQTETAWYWKSADGKSHTELSVPPHSCVYRMHPVSEKVDEKTFAQASRGQP